MSAHGPELPGTRLRHLLDGDVAQVYADLGLAGFRPLAPGAQDARPMRTRIAEKSAALHPTGGLLH